MKKIYNLKTVVINHESINYHYKREKCDVYGNSRFRVFIIDPDGSAVYETIFKCYESQIARRVEMFIEEEQTH